MGVASLELEEDRVATLELLVALLELDAAIDELLGLLEDDGTATLELLDGDTELLDGTAELLDGVEPPVLNIYLLMRN